MDRRRFGRKAQGRMDFMQETHFRNNGQISILRGNQSGALQMDMQVQAQSDIAQPLADKVAIVTGSTSGIGLGIASALAGAGADVVINGLGRPEDIERVLTQLKTDFPRNKITYD